jgi:nucleotide-binding universal stress UspA family protein
MQVMTIDSVVDVAEDGEPGPTGGGATDPVGAAADAGGASEAATSGAGQATGAGDAQRVFLVVVDESEEMRNALRFACRRAQHTKGRVALLYVLEPVEFQHWIGVGRVMEEEARLEAERRMQTLAAQVFAQTGTMPTVHIREGQRTEQLIELLKEDPSISLLVLATAEEGNDPGPLVTFLINNIGRNRFRVPVTLVPGQLSEAEIDALT